MLLDICSFLPVSQVELGFRWQQGSIIWYSAIIILKVDVCLLKMIQIHYFVAILFRLQPAVQCGSVSVCGRGEVRRGKRELCDFPLTLAL